MSNSGQINNQLTVADFIKIRDAMDEAEIPVKTFRDCFGGNVREVDPEGFPPLHEPYWVDLTI